MYEGNRGKKQEKYQTGGTCSGSRDTEGLSTHLYRPSSHSKYLARIYAVAMSRI